MTPQTGAAPKTLAQMVRAKYPGTYDDLSDADLEQKVKAKYPGVYDDVPTSETAPATPTARPRGPATLGEALDFSAPGLRDVLTGAAKGVGLTVTGLGELAHQMPLVSATVDAIYGTPGLSRAAFPAARAALAPTNTAQRLGMGAEQMGEFFLPAAGVAKLKLAAQTGRGVLDAIIGAGIEAASAAAVQTAQQGTPNGAALTTGAVAGGAALAAPVAGKALSWLGQRIESALVKASKADVEAGFKVSNIYKHQLGGSLSQTFDKTGAKLDELGQALKAELSKPGPTGAMPEVDVLQALAEAAKDLTKHQARTLGRNVNIESAIQKFLDDPAFVALQQGKADLLTANELKRGVGELGAWASGARDADANAMEMVANAFYTKLRLAIEQAAPAGPTKIAALNQQMGEILPIRQAIIRRIPVDQRQNVLNLGDIIGVSTGSLGLALANRLLRSGQVANVLAATGPRVGTIPIGPAAGGVTALIRR